MKKPTTRYLVIALDQELYDVVEHLRRFERKGKPRARTQVCRDLMHWGLELYRKQKTQAAEAST